MNRNDLKVLRIYAKIYSLAMALTNAFCDVEQQLDVFIVDALLRMEPSSWFMLSDY
jgi:hypothetical protein